MENVFDRVYEQLLETNRGLVERTIRFNEIALRTQNQLAEQQLAVFESCLETGTKQLQAAADAKDPREFAAQQGQLANELGERLVGVVQKVAAIQGQVRDDLNELMRDGLRVVEAQSAAVRSTAKSTAREAKSAVAKEAKEAKGSSKVAAA